MRSCCLAAVFIMLLGVTWAGAHDLWLVPPPTAAPDKPVVILASVGMDFPKSENAHDTASYLKRLLFRPDGTAGVLEAAGKQDKFGLLRFQPDKPGVYVAAVQTQPRVIKLSAEA